VTALLLVALVLYGLVIGSFLNVVVYRVPAGVSIVRPPSACPGCGQRIAARDNVPVLGWMALGGRCRNCRMRIPLRYPAVEALTAAAFVGVGLRFGWSWTLPAELVLTAGMIVLALIDYDHMKLPRVVVYPVGGAVAALLVLAAAVQGSWGRLGVAAICAAAEFVLLFSIAWISPRSLGFGDVRYGPVLGLGLGWLGWRAAFLGFLGANLLGTVVGLGLMAAGRAGRRSAVPFGVFLSAGAYAAMMAAQYITVLSR
jgi:leader peptidase (prepilin peptidase)/N-methyltransferase